MTTDEKLKTSELIEVLREALKSSQLEAKQLRKDNYALNEKLKRVRKHYDEFFTYRTQKIALNPGQSATTSITTTSEAAFYVTKLVKTGSNFEFLIRDSSNDRQWSNIPVDADSLCNSGLPLILPKPRYLGKRTLITIEFTDLRDPNDRNSLGRSPQEVSLAFVGYKLYSEDDLRKSE